MQNRGIRSQVKARPGKRLRITNALLLAIYLPLYTASNNTLHIPCHNRSYQLYFPPLPSRLISVQHLGQVSREEDVRSGDGTRAIVVEGGKSDPVMDLCNTVCDQMNTASPIRYALVRGAS